jgi:transcriptional regulator with XRE-family HTH domain
MQYVITLIDKASKVCGSDSKLAEKMGIHRVAISEMRAGKRAISPATAAELADIAGDDAREAAINAIIESAKGTRRESVLREILGKALVVGVVGMLAISYNGDSISATKKIANKLDSLYIVLSSETHQGQMV